MPAKRRINKRRADSNLPDLFQQIVDDEHVEYCDENYHLLLDWLYFGTIRVGPREYHRSLDAPPDGSGSLQDLRRPRSRIYSVLARGWKYGAAP